MSVEALVYCITRKHWLEEGVGQVLIPLVQLLMTKGMSLYLILWRYRCSSLGLWTCIILDNQYAFMWHSEEVHMYRNYFKCCSALASVLFRREPGKRVIIWSEQPGNKERGWDRAHHALLMQIFWNIPWGKLIASATTVLRYNSWRAASPLRGFFRCRFPNTSSLWMLTPLQREAIDSRSADAAGGGSTALLVSACSSSMRGAEASCGYNAVFLDNTLSQIHI